MGEGEGGGMSEWMMLGLGVQYVAIMVVYLIEHRFPLALYWLGATILQVAVMWGMRR